MSHNTSCEKRKNGRVALRSKAEDIFSRERKRPRKSPPCYANPYVLYHMYERSVMLMLFNIHNVICLVSIEGDAPGPIHERSTSNLLVVVSRTKRQYRWFTLLNKHRVGCGGLQAQGRN